MLHRPMQELRPGQQIAGYEVIQHVTSGGMASLYLARRKGAAGFSKPVAIKVVHPHLAREKRFVRMFLDEARLAGRIQHPAVVSVEELLEDSGTYLMVMEYIHGCSLFELIRRLAGSQRRLSVELTTWLGAQIADGLHAAHELRDERGELLNVVHRDVSPQNILLSYAGHPKVIDFGIAKSRAQTEATRAGVLRGKIGYMSPEQASGDPLDRRTDIYALGVVLWECLTSRRLFRAENEIKQLDMVREPKVIPPDEFAPVPDALSKVVMAALHPDAKGRIATAKELRGRLLEAVPRVGNVHSSDLAGLLKTVMADKIANDELFEELDGSVERVRASGSFVAQHTQAAPEAAFRSDGDSDIDSNPIFVGLEADVMLSEVTKEPVLPAAPTPTPSRPMASEATAEVLDFDDVAIPPPQGRGSFVPPPVVPGDVPELDFEVVTSLQQPPTEPPKKLRALATLFGTIIVIVALGLAGWLAWREGLFQGGGDSEIDPEPELEARPPPTGYDPNHGTD